MGTQDTEAVRDLLVRTEQAHGVYERDELNGVYDEAWARWYAAYAVENGIEGLIGHPVTAERLAEFLTSTYEALQRSQASSGSWAEFTAERISAEL